MLLGIEDPALYAAQALRELLELVDKLKIYISQFRVVTGCQDIR